MTSMVLGDSTKESLTPSVNVPLGFLIPSYCLLMCRETMKQNEQKQAHGSLQGYRV